MLLAPEALVVIAFALEKLLEVGFAVKLALKSCEGAEAAGKEGVPELCTEREVFSPKPKQRVFT